MEIFPSWNSIDKLKKADYRKAMGESLKSSSEIAVTLNCGSEQVRGLYVNIKYLNIFLEHYCPEFKKR